MVISGKGLNGSMTCDIDSDCPHYKLICRYLFSVTKVKHTPSLHMLAVTDMPKGRGRKGGKPPAKRKINVLLKLIREFR